MYKIVFLLSVILFFNSGCGLIITGVGYAVYDKIGTEKSATLPPEILTIELPAGIQNVFYEHTIETNENCSLSIVSGSLPSGVILHNKLGMLLGTPLESGSFNFNIEAVNEEGLISIESFTWIITTRLSIKNESISYGLEETSYFESLVCEGGLPPYIFSLKSGNLSSLGLSLSSDGKIMGDILQNSSGEFLIEIEIEDSNLENLKQIIKKTYSLKIFKSLKIEDNSLSNGIEGENYTHSLNVSGGSPPYTYTLIDTNNLGISIDTSGNLFGKINAGKYGDYDVTIKIEDSNSLLTQKNFSINIDVGIKIQKTTYANHSMLVNEFLTYNFLIEIADGSQFIIQQYKNDLGIDIGIGFGGTDTLTASSSDAMVLIKINSDGSYNSSIQWGRSEEKFYVKNILDTGSGMYIIGYAYSSDLNVDFGLPFGTSDIKTLNDINDRIGFIIKLNYSFSYIETQIIHDNRINDSILNTDGTEILIVGISNLSPYSTVYTRISTLDTSIIDTKIIGITADSLAKPYIINQNDNTYITGRFKDSSYNFGEAWSVSDIKNRGLGTFSTYLIYLKNNVYQFTKLINKIAGISITCSNANVYLGGHFSEYINFGEDFGINDIYFSATVKGFIIKLSLTLEYEKSKLIEGGESIRVSNIYYKDSLYICGQFSQYIIINENYSKYGQYIRQPYYISLTDSLEYKWCRFINSYCEFSSMFFTSNKIFLSGILYNNTNLDSGYDFPESSLPSIITNTNYVHFIVECK